MDSVVEVFKLCVRAIRAEVFVKRESSTDKEFPFQNWFKERLEALEELGVHYQSSGRNEYPDFTLVEYEAGFELKGLEYPGRETTYDCNSQVPRGEHNGRQMYYVFGRYPKEPDGNKYPVVDFVICHGSFLNADNKYEHKNKNIPGFGSYGDLRIRDRKMYLAPTPYALVEGTEHKRTLILPATHKVGEGLVECGTLVRREAEWVVVAYGFDLRGNTLNTTRVKNPHVGREHEFKAYRTSEEPSSPRVTMSAEQAALSLSGEVDQQELVDRAKAMVESGEFGTAEEALGLFGILFADCLEAGEGEVGPGTISRLAGHHGVPSMNLGFRLAEHVDPYYERVTRWRGE